MEPVIVVHRAFRFNIRGEHYIIQLAHAHVETYGVRLMYAVGVMFVVSPATSAAALQKSLRVLWHKRLGKIECHTNDFEVSRA